MKITFDIHNKNFNLDLEEIDPYYDYLDLKFSFTEDGIREATFTDLSFGYSLLDESEEMSKNEYPKENIEYLFNDQEYLELSRVLGFRSNRNYVISVWVINAGSQYLEDLSFYFPKPLKPFNSWVWNDAIIQWQAPVQYPGGDEEPFYIWNEEDQSWDMFISEEES